MNREQWLWLILSVCVFAGGWTVRGWIAERDEARVAKAAAETRQRASMAAQAALEKSQAQTRALQAQIEEVDRRGQEEVENAKRETDQLRADLAAGRRRLSIAARCPAGGRVPAIAAGAGLGDAGARAEINPEAAQRIVAITDDGDQAIRQLTACQAILQAERSD